MPTRIPSLRRYQRSRRFGRFDDLQPVQRAAAEAHYQRLCARWGDDLPQWRRAILIGRAKDLVVRPRDGAWARTLRRKGKTRSVTPILHTLAPPPTAPRAATVALQPVAESHSPVNVARPPDQVKVALSPHEPSISLAPCVHAIRLDVRGMTPSGADGADTAQRILRDLEHRAFGQSPHFSMAVPGKDLPPRWAWRLEVVPVP